MNARVDERPIGNSQLLEAAYTRPKVFPRRGGPEGETTAELHQRVLGGKFCLPTQRLRTAVLILLASGTKLSKHILISHSVHTPIPVYLSLFPPTVSTPAMQLYANIKT